MWILGVVGFVGSLLAFVLSFIPPGQIATGSNTVWYTVLIAGCVIMVVIPLIIYSMRKPSWRDPKTDFAPFHSDK
jgi:phosphotransferase system  glucose/maltose/N-acetylglucosamine-specific IIC component